MAGFAETIHRLTAGQGVSVQRLAALADRRRGIGRFRSPEEAKANAERAGAEVRNCSRCIP